LKEDFWREESLLLDGIPSGAWHHGGRLKIGFDGKLYATTGDAYEAAVAQDDSSLGGKILRINHDGSIPTDNPFSNSYVFSYGHRNPHMIHTQEWFHRYLHLEMRQHGHHPGWIFLTKNCTLHH
jgi:glucose/arabinose dehydrogenase